jgi:hypothetical protein
MTSPKFVGGRGITSRAPFGFSLQWREILAPR